MKHSAFIIIVVSFLFASCGSSNKITSFYSDNSYNPIPEVDLSYYESVQSRPNQDKDKAIGIAISGGGSRAQYFGLGCLIGFDEIKKNNSSLLNETDYFSTVSGGGFAAGYYLTLKKNKVLDNYDSLFEFWKSDDRKAVLQEFLFKDASALSVLKLNRYENNKIKKPYPVMIDYELLQRDKLYRGHKIERLFLSDFFVKKDSGTVDMSMFIPNGTIYNNGERLPFMPHIISSLNLESSMLPVEDFKSTNGYNLPLTYCITGSAAFPGVLPMLKLKSKNGKIVRIIDGGAVDNLGYMTLLEVLNADKKVDPVKKKAVFIDCAGLGTESQYQDDAKVGLGSLVQKMLLYTVDVNILNSKKNLKILSDTYKIPANNILSIGFESLKKEITKKNEKASRQELTELETLKNNLKSGKLDWEGCYRNLVASMNLKQINENNLSELPSSKFADFTLIQAFELFELSAQIETKIKIYPWEKEILILAGRYCSHINECGLQQLLEPKNCLSQ